MEVEVKGFRGKKKSSTSMRKKVISQLTCVDQMSPWTKPRLSFLCIWIFSTFSVLCFSSGVLGDNLALLTGTLRTYQKAACDSEYMILRCPSGTTITVQLAQYGNTTPTLGLCQTPGTIHPELVDSITDPYNNITCQLPHAIQTVVGLCQKKTSCKFQTSPRTFGGDPCPGSRKFLEVIWKCRPSEFKSVIGCESEVIQLKCNRSSRLAIYSANYGRTEYEAVQCPQKRGVQEESCLSSFATETVMQLCHGRRRCSLSVDPATFGNPCKPESSMYLKVIYTCVPRKVLKEKYQGETEPDEMFEDETDETEYETGEAEIVGGVLEQPSIYSPDHSKAKGWVSPKSTSKPSNIPSKNITSDKSIVEVKSGVEPSPVLVEDDENGKSFPQENPYNSQDVHIIYLISQGIRAYEFISRNSDKLWLYIAISIASCLMVILFVLLVKIGVQRSRRQPSSSQTTSKVLSSSSGGKLSDIDEISVVRELPSILRKSSGQGQDSPPCELVSNYGYNGVAVTSESSTMTRIGPACNVQMMNPSNNDLLTTMTLGRGLNRPREPATNIRFYYD